MASSSWSSAPKPGQGVSTQRQIGHCIRWDRLMYIVLLFIRFFFGEESYKNQWNPPAIIFIRKIEPIWCWLGKIWWNSPFLGIVTYPLFWRHLWRWCSVSKGGICLFRGGQIQRECWGSPPHQWSENGYLLGVVRSNLLFLKTAMFCTKPGMIRGRRSFFRITWTHKCYEGILITQYSMSFVSWKEIYSMDIWISWGEKKPHHPTLYTSNQKGFTLQPFWWKIQPKFQPVWWKSNLPHQNSNHFFQPTFWGSIFFSATRSGDNIDPEVRMGTWRRKQKRRAVNVCHGWNEFNEKT